MLIYDAILNFFFEHRYILINRISILKNGSNWNASLNLSTKHKQLLIIKAAIVKIMYKTHKNSTSPCESSKKFTPNFHPLKKGWILKYILFQVTHKSNNISPYCFIYPKSKYKKSCIKSQTSSYLHNNNITFAHNIITIIFVFALFVIIYHSRNQAIERLALIPWIKSVKLYHLPYYIFIDKIFKLVYLCLNACVCNELNWKMEMKFFSYYMIYIRLQLWENCF